MALGGRLVQPALPGRLTPLASPAPPGRCYPHTKLAIRMVRQSDEHPMTNSSGMNLDSFSWPAKRASIRDDTSKTRQICAGLRYQGNQLRDEVQRLEYDVCGAVAVRCLSGAA